MADATQSAWLQGLLPEHRGPVTLPGTGRMVFWTGRVVIGIRYQPAPDYEQPVPSSQLWVQDVMLARTQPGETSHV